MSFSQGGGLSRAARVNLPSPSTAGYPHLMSSIAATREELSVSTAALRRRRVARRASATS